MKAAPNWIIATTLLAVFGVLAPAPASASAQIAASTNVSAPDAHPEMPAVGAKKFVKLGDGAISSPFTTPTVLKLNAIVRRSKAAIDDYDASIAETRASVEAARAANAPSSARRKAWAMLAKLEKLAGQAATAHADLDKAEVALNASGEVYNTTVLGGMKTFTTDVDTEIHAAASELSARLAAR